MNGGEFARLPALGLSAGAIQARRTEAVEALIATGGTPETRARAVALMRESDGAAIWGDPGLDETLEAIRAEMRRFAAAEVEPHAHGWHLANAYIPLGVVKAMADLGVFGLTVPEEYRRASASPRCRCASSRRSCRAPISASARSAPDPRSRPNSSSPAAPRPRRRNGSPRIADGSVLPTARLHRAEHRLRPREPEDARGAGGRRLPGISAPRPGSRTPSAPT